MVVAAAPKAYPHLQRHRVQYHFPLLLLSGVLFRLSLAPTWLQDIAALNPLRNAVDAARAVFNAAPGDASVIKGFVVVGLLAAVSVVAAVRSFSRSLS